MLLFLHNNLFTLLHCKHLKKRRGFGAIQYMYTEQLVRAELTRANLVIFPNDRLYHNTEHIFVKALIFVCS